MYVYDLTPLTRKANEDRRTVIATFDVSRRLVIVFALAFLPSLFLAAVFHLIFRTATVSVPVFTLAEAVAIWLFMTRSNNGLRLRRAEALGDRFGSTKVGAEVKASLKGGWAGTPANQLLVCWQPVTEQFDPLAIICSNTVPVEQPDLQDVLR